MKRIAKGLSNSLLLIALLSGFAMADVATYDFSAGSAVTGVNEASPGIALDGNIGFGSFKNGGTVDPALNTGQLRLYQDDTKGGSIKIYANNGVTITQVIVHSSGTTGPAAYTADGGSAIDLADGTTYTMSGLASTSEIEFYQKDADKSNRIYVDDFEVTYTLGSGVGNPTAFSATVQSTSQINLTWLNNGAGNNVIVAFNSDGVFTAPVDGTSYSEEQEALGGEILYKGIAQAMSHQGLSANTTYYYKAWSVDGDDNYSSSVSANATTIKAEPAAHVTALASTSDHSSITLTWTDASADGYQVKVSTTSLAAITAPVDGAENADDTDLSDGSGLVSVPDGDEESIWSGLDAETSYYFKIYPFNNSGTLIDYKTDGSVPTETKATTAAPSWDYTNIEGFDNSEATGSYADGSFVGQSSITWTYVASRDENGDANGSGIDGNALMLRQVSDASSITSSTISSGISDFAVKLYKGFTGGGNRQVELFVNGVSKGTSTAFDDFNEHIFIVEDINIAGDIVISLVNITGKQVIVDDISWNNLDTPLPISLSSFTATEKTGVVELRWETSSETDNAAFHLYRNEELIARIDGAGTISKTQNYSYTDTTVVPGVSYTYLLADVDYVHNETRYDNKAVTIELTNDVLEADFVIGAAYPNPFNPRVAISYQLTANSKVSATIYNAQGILVDQLYNNIATAGEHELTWDASNMPSGVYIIQVQAGNTVEAQKVVLMK